MKPALCYAVVRQLRGRDFAIMAVTSEKRNGHVYGRWIDDDTPTNRASRDVIVKVETLDQAKGAIAAAEAVDKATRAEIDATRAKLSRLECQRREAMLDAMRSFRLPSNETPRPPL